VLTVYTVATDGVNEMNSGGAGLPGRCVDRNGRPECFFVSLISLLEQSNGRNDYYYLLDSCFGQEELHSLDLILFHEMLFGVFSLAGNNLIEVNGKTTLCDIPSSKLPDDITATSVLIYCGKSHDGSVICTLTMHTVSTD
jgi:hypothetical protein